MKYKNVHWYSKDVHWYAGKYKRPIAYSTRAASDLICAISEQGYTTPNEIIRQITYDTEAKQVMQAYIDKGFGDTPLNLQF